MANHGRHDLDNLGIRRSRRLWTALIALLVAMQLALVFHQSQHHLNPDMLAGDDCALCQIVSGMAAAPAAPAIVLPIFIVLEIVLLSRSFAPRAVRIASAFHPRAPPAALSL